METRSSSNIFVATGAQAGDPVFTLGTHPIPRTLRAWDRAPRSPHKRHRRGIKVWARSGPATGREADDLANAQLLGEFVADAAGHAAKRQRVQDMPAVSTTMVPAKMQKQSSYAPTLSDGAQRPKRKIAKRRQSTKSPVKAIQEDSWLSPTKSTKRRKSSLNPVSVRKSLDRVKPLDSPLSGLAELSKPMGLEETSDEPSFLKSVDLCGSTMFDHEAAESSNDSRRLDLSSEEGDENDSTAEDDSTVEDIQSGDETDGDNSEGELDAESEAEEDSALPDDETNKTARLLDAGNTGVVDVLLEDGAGSEDDLDDTTATDDDFNLQANVAGMLSTPLGEQQSLSEDHTSATPSPATEDVALKADVEHQSGPVTSPTPSLQRDDTVSTVEFDEPFSQSTVLQVERDNIFESPEATLDVSSIVKASAIVTPTTLPSGLAAVSDELVEDMFASRNMDDEDGSGLSESRHAVRRASQAAPETVPEAEPSDEESEDELFTGEPTLSNVVFSPVKATHSPIPSPSPRKTRLLPRLSDDTNYLNDFLSRVKAQAAAKPRHPAPSPAKASTPRKSPRKALGLLDANSPSPTPLPSQRRSSKDNGSPVKSPKTPMARMLLEDTMSPDTPDELGEPTTEDPETELDVPRRSVRSRLPAPPRLAMTAPNAISVRRLEGETFSMRRSGAQKLATTTRSNTLRNKGNAVMPRSVLEELEGKELSPIKQRGIGKNKKGQNVDWDNTLVYYLEEQKQKEHEKEKVKEREKGRTKRKAKVLDSDHGVQEVKEDDGLTDTTTPQAKKRAVKIARIPHHANGRSSVVEQAPVEPPKLAETEKKIPVSRLRKPRAGTSSVQGTPAAKKIESRAESVPSGLPAPRRMTRRG